MKLSKLLKFSRDVGAALNGRQSFSATTGATTILTVPAGRTWAGQIGASVSCANAGANAVQAQATAVFSVLGAGAVPPAGNVWGIDARAGANVAGGTAGSEAQNYGRVDFSVTAPVNNSVAIQVASTNAGTSSLVDAFAIGELV